MNHSTWEGSGYVGFESKADMRAAKSHVRFTPNSDRESEISQKAMSALPPKADMCGATSDVRFGPIADMCSAARALGQKRTHAAQQKGPLFDHLVGA